jgi:hypothetical protein
MPPAKLLNRVHELVAEEAALPAVPAWWSWVLEGLVVSAVSSWARSATT